MALVGMGVPVPLLYKPGQAPQKVAANSPYTPFAGSVLINGNQAEVYAKFLAELEQTGPGKKFTGVAGEGNGPLVLYGVLSLFASVQYVQGLRQFYNQLKPLLDQYQAAQAQATANAAAQQQQQGGL